MQITMYLICVERMAIFGNIMAPTRQHRKHRKRFELCLCLLSNIWQLLWIFGPDTHNIRTLSLKIKCIWNWPEKISKKRSTSF